jgi:hypothetical protein
MGGQIMKRILIIIFSILALSACLTTSNSQDDGLLYVGLMGCLRYDYTDSDYPEISSITFKDGMILPEGKDFSYYAFSHRTKEGDTLRVQNPSFTMFKSSPDQVSITINTYSSIIGFSERLSPNILIEIAQEGINTVVYDREESDLYPPLDGKYSEKNNLESYTVDVTGFNLDEYFIISITIEDKTYTLSYLYEGVDNDKIMWKNIITYKEVIEY